MFLNVVSRSEVALIALISIKIRIVIDAVRVVSFHVINYISVTQH